MADVATKAAEDIVINHIKEDALKHPLFNFIYLNTPYHDIYLIGRILKNRSKR
jgi:hypothetical protein